MNGAPFVGVMGGGPASRRGRLVTTTVSVVLAAVTLLPSLAIGTGGTLMAPAPPAPRSVGHPGMSGPVEPRTIAGGQSRLIVTTTDAAAVPNQGLRTNLSDYFALGLEPYSSFQVAAEETIGTYEAVFGIFQNDVTYPVPFFTIFSNVTDATIHLAYWTNETLVEGATYEFELALAGGTNWTLTVNGALFGGNASDATFDFGATSATWLGGLGFSEVALFAGALPTPALVHVPLAFATLVGGAWYLPEEAAAQFVTANATWGVAGRAQNGTLPPGTLDTGTSIAGLASGSTVWLGGPVAVVVHVTPEAAAILGTAPLRVVVTVDTVTGSPLPAVSVAFHDEVGSGFGPPFVITNASGGATVVLESANVTASSVDHLTGTVTNFGYRGSAIASVAIDPAVQLLVRLSAPVASVTVRTTTTIAVSAVAVSGTPGGGVLVLFRVAGGIATVPAYATTDETGGIPLPVVAPPTPGPIVLTAYVGTPGYWGHGSLQLNVTPAPPTLAEELAPYELPIAVGVAALAAFLLLRIRRRGAQRLPRLAVEGVQPASEPDAGRAPGDQP